MLSHLCDRYSISGSRKDYATSLVCTERDCIYLCCVIFNKFSAGAVANDNFVINCAAVFFTKLKVLYIYIYIYRIIRLIFFLLLWCVFQAN